MFADKPCVTNETGLPSVPLMIGASLSVAPGSLFMTLGGVLSATAAETTLKPGATASAFVGLSGRPAITVGVAVGVTEAGAVDVVCCAGVEVPVFVGVAGAAFGVNDDDEVSVALKPKLLIVEMLAM